MHICACTCTCARTCTHDVHVRAVTVSVHLFRREQGPLVEVQVDSESVACDSSVRALLSGWGRRPRPSSFDQPLASRLDLRPNHRQVALEARLDHEERSRLASLRALCPGYFALPGETLDGLTPCFNLPQPEPQTYRNPTLPGPIPNHVGKKLDHLHRRRQRTTDRRGIRFPRTAQGAYNTGY